MATYQEYKSRSNGNAYDIDGSFGIAILYIPLAVVAFFSYPIYLLFGKEE
ncbi:hypothetical protein FLJ02_11745 [Streptococcus agalactiae]